MPLKIDIHLDSGFGGERLSGFWIARKDTIQQTQKIYTYQISADIHPWRTLTEIEFKRGKGHLLLVAKALEALDAEGYKNISQSNTETFGDTQRLDAFRMLRSEQIAHAEDTL